LQTNLIKAYERKLISEEEIDLALSALLRTQFKLGFFDDKKKVPFNNLGENDVNNEKHVQLARVAAQQSIVLLKNSNNILPLKKEKYGSIMVLGANAGAMDPMVANYHGMSGNIVTFAEGITKAAGPAVAVQYDQGSDFNDTTRFGGLWHAGESDITIAVIGLTPVYEGEGGDAFLAANGGDKLTLDLPAPHVILLRELRKKNKPVIAVITAGSNVDISSIEPYADAILLAWYPGEQGGNAVADIIFGNVSPAGRLPVTFYASFNDLPAYDSYDMKGRTYRYFNGNVQYPFGFGLSYTSFDYTWEKQPAELKSVDDTLSFSVRVSNTGSVNGDEVAQLYIEYPNLERMPVKELKGFKRVNIEAGGSREVQFKLPVAELKKWDMDQKKWVLYPGQYIIQIGSSSRDIKLNSPLIVKPGLN
jgi:beta-glucosidase